MRRLSARNLSPLASLLVFLAAGCAGDGGDLTGPETDPEKPQPELRDVFDVSVEVLRVRGSQVETCDGKLLLGGAVNPGEYQFKTTIYRGNAQLSTLATPGYNSVAGQSFELGPDEPRNHKHSASFNGAASGEDVAIFFRATEWDGLNKDSRLSNASTELAIPLGPNTTTGSYPVEKTIGSNKCGMTVQAHVTIRKRQVPVS